MERRLRVASLTLGGLFQERRVQAHGFFALVRRCSVRGLRPERGEIHLASNGLASCSMAKPDPGSLYMQQQSVSVGWGAPLNSLTAAEV